MDHRSRLRDAVSQRVLLICAERMLRERMVAEIEDLGIEVLAVEEERTALAQFVRQSFPVVICDQKRAAAERSWLGSFAVSPSSPYTY